MGFEWKKAVFGKMLINYEFLQNISKHYLFCIASCRLVQVKLFVGKGVVAFLNIECSETSHEITVKYYLGSERKNYKICAFKTKSHRPFDLRSQLNQSQKAKLDHIMNNLTDVDEFEKRGTVRSAYIQSMSDYTLDWQKYIKS